MMNRRDFIRSMVIGIGAFCLGGWQKLVRAEDREYYRLVVLGDPHLPVRVLQHPKQGDQQAILAAKNGVIQDINAWDDVDAVTVVGDIVEQRAVPKEYAYIRQFFGRLTRKLWVINGNHDFLYKDEPKANGKPDLADAASWKRKLEYFRTFWQLPKRWYTKEVGKYHLIFLSAEDGPLPTAIGAEQLEWLTADLEDHKQTPTLIFFHGPLYKTLLDYSDSVNTKRSIAMPEERLHPLLDANPQVMLWISGHTHTPCTNASYAAVGINQYNAHTYDIHNDCMDRKQITTNSLYLYPDRIEVKTFNHKTGQWMPEFDRKFMVQ